MASAEIMLTRYGEMLDLIACHGIYTGALIEKKKKTWTFEEAIALE